MDLHVIGFGSLNLDEMWEAPLSFLREFNLETGSETVRDIDWFERFYPELNRRASLCEISPGGSSANTIAALKKMGFETGFFGACGAKDYGPLNLESLGAQENLMIAKLDAASGRCISLMSNEDPSRDRRLIILPNANNLLGEVNLDLDFFNRAQWVHMTSFASSGVMKSQIKAASSLKDGTKLSFDPGPIYSGKGFSELRPLLERTDILFGDMIELTAMTDGKRDPIRFLFNTGVKAIVEKRGPEGIALHMPAIEIFRPSVSVSVVKDRTGAGDVAAAGFLAGRLADLPDRDCLEIAVAAAAKSIEGFGRSAYPDRGFYDQMVLSRKPMEILQ